MTTRSAIYVRVSSEEQTKGFSLEAQEKAARQFAAAKGWEVVAIYVDPGFSAKTDKRPKFQQMIADAQAGMFDAIIVHKFDRFARNRKDAVTYKALLKQDGIAVYSVSEPIDSDDPSGVITEGMLEVLAEYYSANLSRETMKGKRARAEAGYQNNGTPFGYVKAKGRDAVAHIDPQTIDGYKLAMSKALEGESDLQIAWALNQAGYRTTRGKLFAKDTVAAILQNRFYLGEVNYKGKQYYAGRHEAAIDPDTWEHVQVIRRGRATRPNHANIGTRSFALTTVLYCAECGGKMRGGGGRKSRIYRCTGKEHGLNCKQGETHADLLESQVGEFISGLCLPDDWRAKALSMIGEESGEVERIERDRRKMDGELSRARSLYVSGDMPEAEYNQHRVRITTSLSNLVLPTMPDLSGAALILSDFGKVWKLATGQEQKRLVSVLLARVWVKDRTVVGIEPKAGPYYVLATAESARPVESA